MWSCSQSWIRHIGGEIIFSEIKLCKTEYVQMNLAEQFQETKVIWAPGILTQLVPICAPSASSSTGFGCCLLEGNAKQSWNSWHRCAVMPFPSSLQEIASFCALPVSSNWGSGTQAASYNIVQSSSPEDKFLTAASVSHGKNMYCFLLITTLSLKQNQPTKQTNKNTVCRGVKRQ